MDGITFSEWLCRQFPNTSRFVPSSLQRLRSIGALPYPSWVFNCFDRYSTSFDGLSSGSSPPRSGSPQAPGSRDAERKAAASWSLISNVVQLSSPLRRSSRSPPGSRGDEASAASPYRSIPRGSVSVRSATGRGAVTSTPRVTSPSTKRVITAESLTQIIRDGLPDDARTLTSAFMCAQQAIRTYADATLTDHQLDEGPPTGGIPRMSLDVVEPQSNAVSTPGTALCLTLLDFCRAVGEDPLLRQLGRW